MKVPCSVDSVLATVIDVTRISVTCVRKAFISQVTHVWLSVEKASSMMTCLENVNLAIGAAKPVLGIATRTALGAKKISCCLMDSAWIQEIINPLGNSGMMKINSYNLVILHAGPVTNLLKCVLHVQKEIFLSMTRVSPSALNKLLPMLKVESARCAWTVARCAPTSGTARSVRLNKTSPSFSTKADAYRNALRDTLMTLGLARNAVNPVRHAWEMPPNVSPVKVLCFWSSGNVNLPVQRDILPLMESVNIAPKCVRSAFTVKRAKNAWMSSSCTKGSVWRTALPTSMLKRNTAFPAMNTARIVMDQTQMTVLSVPSATSSSMVACVLKTAPKGLIMKKRQKIVKHAIGHARLVRLPLPALLAEMA